MSFGSRLQILAIFLDRPPVWRCVHLTSTSWLQCSSWPRSWLLPVLPRYRRMSLRPRIGALAGAAPRSLTT